MINNKYWIWLTRLNKVDENVLNSLLSKYKTPEKIWHLDNIELLKNNIKKEYIDEILNKNYRENLDKYEEYLNKHKIELLKIHEKLYPQKLKNIYNPPLVLYIKGNKEILNNNSLAIVGCRNCSLYGKQISQSIATGISKYNINIVSGLARGIDANAHIGALKCKGKTVAVVGTGLDITYPRENEYLEKQIIEQGGAIVSEFVIGTPIAKNNFPKRNRIISGISDGVLVVEARKKSGTFITVDFALEQGKTVYIIPGNITQETSGGTNNLAKQGAKIVTDLEDILEDFC